MKSFSIIIPAYNEEDNISKIRTELVPAISRITKNYEIIVVDDGSNDSTALKVKALKKKNKHIFLVSYKPNKGIGHALSTGIKYAKKDLTVFLDSDMTFHPKDIQQLFLRFEKGDIDFVIGSPFNDQNEAVFWRLTLSKIVNRVYCVLLGSRINAITPIFRLYKTKQIKELNIGSRGFDINVEILFKLLQNKRKFAEVPVKLGKREFGVSKLNYFKESLNHLKLVSKIIKWKLFK